MMRRVIRDRRCRHYRRAEGQGQVCENHGSGSEGVTPARYPDDHRGSQLRHSLGGLDV